MVEDDRAGYVRRLLAARLPELTDADIVSLAQPDFDTGVPAEISDKIADVIEAMEVRLSGLEQVVGTPSADAAETGLRGATLGDGTG